MRKKLLLGISSLAVIGLCGCGASGNPVNTVSTPENETAYLVSMEDGDDSDHEENYEQYLESKAASELMSLESVDDVTMTRNEDDKTIDVTVVGSKELESENYDDVYEYLEVIFPDYEIHINETDQES